MSMVVRTKASDRCLRLNDANTEEILPGISDEIVTFLLSPKISWRDIRTLSAVSSDWLSAVRSRRLYDARVRAKATETLILVTYGRTMRSKKVTAMAVYSMRDNYCIDLPPIPQLDAGIPRYSQFVSLDGKVYVLGGLKDKGVFTHDCDYHNFNSDKVFVLDLAGHQQWKQCASMRERRHRFGCGAIDGKIYVFGGTLGPGPRSGSEAYDPKTDTWSPIRPMSALQCNHRVAIVGEELLLHGGSVCDPIDEAQMTRHQRRGTNSHNRLYTPLGRGFTDFEDLESDDDNWSGELYFFRSLRSLNDCPRPAKSLEFYNPSRDEWRVAKPLRIRYEPHSFAFWAQGKLHMMTPVSISVHDVEWQRLNGHPGQWKLIHILSFDALGPNKFIKVNIVAALAVEDLLFTIVNWYNSSTSERGSCLLQTREFGEEKALIVVWEKADCFSPCADWSPSSVKTTYNLHPIQL